MNKKKQSTKRKGWFSIIVIETYFNTQQTNPPKIRKFNKPKQPRIQKHKRLSLVYERQEAQLEAEATKQYGQPYSHIFYLFIFLGLG